jgi:hypothetical protein
MTEVLIEGGWGEKALGQKVSFSLPQLPYFYHEYSLSGKGVNPHPLLKNSI